MEFPLDPEVDQNNRLIQVGAEHARDIHALCSDVSAIIFPSAITQATEATITAVSSKLRQLVSDIEAQLITADTQPRPGTWEMLARSGFLRETDLIDFMLARVAEDRLDALLGDTASSMTRELLDHADGNIANAAQMLLAARSLHRNGAGRTYLELPAEILHKLCWRIVAAVEVLRGARQPDTIASARHLIEQYSEASRAQAAAGKIVHFMDETARRNLLDPKEAGLHLYVASLSACLELDHDHILQIIDAGSSTPYAVTLKALDIPKDQAIDAIIALRSDKVTTRDAGIIDDGYDLIDVDAAKSQVHEWAATRANYLVFGQP
jgi:hypothetical protein